MPFHQLYLHLVFATSARMPFIKPHLERTLWAAIAGRCKGQKCEPIAVGGTEDHVHTLLQLPTTISVAELAKDLKGASSFLMSHELARGDVFRWQEGYGAFTLRKAEVDRVATYIARQKEHHAGGQLLGLLERCET